MRDKHFVVECPACGDGDGHLWGCPLRDETIELHPAGTRDELDAIDHTFAKFGHPLGDLTRVQCIQAMEADVTNWIEIANDRQHDLDALHMEIARWGLRCKNCQQT